MQRAISFILITVHLYNNMLTVLHYTEGLRTCFSSHSMSCKILQIQKGKKHFGACVGFLGVPIDNFLNQTSDIAARDEHHARKRGNCMKTCTHLQVSLEFMSRTKVIEVYSFSFKMGFVIFQFICS